MRILPKSNLAVLKYLVLVPIILGWFFYQGYYLSRNTYPFDDQADYLTYAIQIKESGGVLKFPYNLVTNNFTENRKHPLYSVLLAPFSQSDQIFFKNAKYSNFVLSFILILTIFGVTIKSFGAVPAIVAAVVFACNKFLVEEFAAVVPDSLFAMFVALSWFYIWKGLEESRSKNLIWGMVFCSLAFLAKPAGILILLSYIFGASVIYRLSIFKSKNFWLSLVAFFLISSPLIIRNILVYKNPFYNNNTSLLWIDNRQERRAVGFKENPPTALDYFKTHPIDKEISQLAQNSVKIISNVSLIALFEVQRLRYPILLLLFMLLGMFADPNRKRALFSLVLFGAFFVFFSYNYRVSPHYRHLIPVGFIFIVYPIFGLFKLKYLRSLKSLMVLVAFVPLLFAYQTGKIVPISRVEAGLIEMPSEQNALFLFAKENFNQDTIYIKGNEERLSYEWYTNIPGKKINHPYLNSFNELTTFIKENQIKYIILGPSTAYSFPQIYDEYFNYSSGRIKVMSTPKSWSLVLSYSGSDKGALPRVLIYEII